MKKKQVTKSYGLKYSGGTPSSGVQATVNGVSGIIASFVFAGILFGTWWSYYYLTSLEDRELLRQYKVSRENIERASVLGYDLFDAYALDKKDLQLMFEIKVRKICGNVIHETKSK